MLQCLHPCGLWPVSQGGDGVHGHPMPPLVRHGVNWEGSTPSEWACTAAPVERGSAKWTAVW